jgi:hypothetical protein
LCTIADQSFKSRQRTNRARLKKVARATRLLFPKEPQATSNRQGNDYRKDGRARVGFNSFKKMLDPAPHAHANASQYYIDDGAPLRNFPLVKAMRRHTVSSE